MTNESSEFPYSHFRSQTQLRTGILIWQIVSPILLVFGTIGNILSVIVLTRRTMKQFVSSTYLLGLSVADLMVLYIGLLRQWIRYLVGFDIRTSANWICKVHSFVQYAVLDFSVWLLTMFTVERLIPTFKPFSNRIICTQKRARMIIAMIGIVVAVINSHILYGMERKPAGTGNKTQDYSCGPSDVYANFFFFVWNYIDLCKFSLMPFLILSLSNICIIYKVVSNNRKMKCQVAPSTSKSTHRKASSMSRLLLALNIEFIFCTAPVCVYLISEPYWIPRDVPRNVQLEDPWWAVVNILMYTNNAVNFILYCLSGSTFRQELKRVLKTTADT